ncbi:hypothetical protein GDO81_004729 [Engystomops pustulosus]|uniref:Uncharacterized protein n=1 Tax=Engystomops pustulosus TaxID=76066 RepID=A0AAV7CJ67_ENGPU|nr:hypothetical protein GDO81_004729 [Engystomops pustulosus]
MHSNFKTKKPTCCFLPYPYVLYKMHMCLLMPFKNERQMHCQYEAPHISVYVGNVVISQKIHWSVNSYRTFPSFFFTSTGGSILSSLWISRSKRWL